MDNDGWLDLLIANGHVYPQVDSANVGATYKEPLLLHRNNRDGTFDDVTSRSGLSALPLKSRRGAAFGDIFNTGNIDVVLLNVGEPPSLLLNTNHDGNHRVLFHLVGTKSNSAGPAAPSKNFKVLPRTPSTPSSKAPASRIATILTRRLRNDRRLSPNPWMPSTIEGRVTNAILGARKNTS
jgi:hypothetical protein